MSNAKIVLNSETSFIFTPTALDFQALPRAFCAVFRNFAKQK